jgi:hypothetical protein
MSLHRSFRCPPLAQDRDAERLRPARQRTSMLGSHAIEYSAQLQRDWNSADARCCSSRCMIVFRLARQSRDNVAKERPNETQLFLRKTPPEGISHGRGLEFV